MSEIHSEHHWRVSMSGYSIKCGWADNTRIVCAYHGGAGKLDAERFKQWLEDAEHICDLHNATLPPTVETGGAGMTSKRTFETSLIIALAMMGVEIPKPERPENDIEGVPID